jgi:AhpD family alkylhydroperoxidase
MSASPAAFFDRWQSDVEAMKEHTPDVVNSFGGVFQKLMKEGALSVREKELIAMSLGMALRCAPCLNLHIEKCLKAGATRAQILEAAAVVVVMQGGPGFTHVPDVIRALDHLENK